MKQLVALVPPLVLVLAAPVSGQSGPEATLLELNRRLFETKVLDRDPAFLRSISDDTYVVIAPGGVVESREQVIRDLGAFVTVDSLSIENERVVVSGPTAVVLNRLVLHGRVQGPLGELGPITVMTVFTRGDDGGWRAVSRAYSTCDAGAVAHGLC
jgi:ketosteroid isomerase-like protein